MSTKIGGVVPNIGAEVGGSCDNGLSVILRLISQYCSQILIEHETTSVLPNQPAVTM